VPDEKPSLEEQERLLRERELKLKELEIARREKEVATSKWLHPLVLGLFAAAIGLIGNVIVTKSNNSNITNIEHFRAQSTLILEAIKTNGDTRAACKNLTFFVNLGLLDDTNRTIVGACPESTQGVPTLPADVSGGSLASSSRVTVIVKDGRGKPISGATVRITNVKSVDMGGCKTLTNGQCKFGSPLKFDDSFTVSVEKEGYLKKESPEVWDGFPITIVLDKQVNSGR